MAALILAGGETPPQMADVANGEMRRALIAVRGRPMLALVVDALQKGMMEAGGAGRVLVAGDNLPLFPSTEQVSGGGTLVDTLLNGVAALRPDETRLLVATADLPFLTAEAVADFLQRADAEGQGAQFVYSIVDAARCAEAFPGMKRTTLKVQEGIFTGGNLVLVDPAHLRQNEALVRRLYAERKSVPGLARILGPSVIFSLLVSRIFPAALSIKPLEERFGRAIGGKAKVIVSPFPEIAADADRPEDITLARERLGGVESKP